MKLHAYTLHTSSGKIGSLMLAVLLAFPYKDLVIAIFVQPYHPLNLRVPRRESQGCSRFEKPNPCEQNSQIILFITTLEILKYISLG